MSTPDSSRIVWRKSSLSGAGQDCVEVGVWRRSAPGGNDASCVEVALASDAQVAPERTADAEQLFLIRDSKEPDGLVLAFMSSEWNAFLVSIKNGDLVDLDR
ncbi:DUF397 domain-containing protein [Streptosporangium sp. OZ121]|uniref:DUF397 domain-containing protein n=1 Tax=Streptosporangium sp. OZ121 TaxID=3444183 RepID=UPI003F7A7D0F